MTDTRTRNFRGGFTLRCLEVTSKRHPTRDIAEAEAVRMLAERPGAGIIISQEVACVKLHIDQAPQTNPPHEIG